MSISSKLGVSQFMIVPFGSRAVEARGSSGIACALSSVKADNFWKLLAKERWAQGKFQNWTVNDPSTLVGGAATE